MRRSTTCHRKPYRGINTLLLPQGGEYLTFKQVQDLGGRIKRGSHAHLVVYFKLLPGARRPRTGTSGGAIPLLRYYNVFALADTEGIPSKLAAPVEHEPIAEAEAIIAGYVDGPKIVQRRQDRAYYAPTLDTVIMPTMAQFPQVEAFYNVVNHELIHSTGHSSRLDRFDGKDSTIFASESIQPRRS